jgi:hypothetical protein
VPSRVKSQAKKGLSLKIVAAILTTLASLKLTAGELDEDCR